MTTALLWKEYRQQRSIWICIAFLGVLLVVTLGVVIGQRRGLEVIKDPRFRGAVEMTVLCLMVAYGVISGAMLLAGERDEGTQVFLDSLCTWRWPLWQRKFMAGALFTISLSAVLAGLALGAGAWETAIALPFMGLIALAWGLLGGALCKTALTGVMAGIGMMGASWIMFSIGKFAPVIIVGQAIAGIGAAVASRKIFCQDDRLRLPARKRSTMPASEGLRRHISELRVQMELAIKEEEALERQAGFFRAEPFDEESPGSAKGKSGPTAAGEWSVLLWLVLRQGRWVLGAALPVALLFGLIVHHSPVFLWPIGMIFMGVAFGVTAFAPDQNDGGRLLSTQRLPAGTIWKVKVLFWGLAIVLMTLITWFIATEAIFALPIFNMLIPDGAGGPARKALTAAPAEWIKNCMHWGNPPSVVDAALLVVIWPLYGFSFGLFYGQMMRRPALGAIQAVAVTPFIAAVWLPTLAVGGVSAWQVFLVPLVLIGTTRLAMRPWLAGRLLDRRPLMGIVAAATLIPVLLAGCMWHRAVEVPDIGEPFDVKGFIDSLPTTGTNEANTLIRRARQEMVAQRNKVMKEMSGGGKEPPDFWDEPPPWQDNPSRYNPSQILGIIRESGWPQNDKATVRWLDQLFAGEWALKIHKAAGLPLGVLQDPRFPEQSGLAEDLLEMSSLLSLRALQLQAQGDSRGGLDQLATALALTRQVRHQATNDGLRLGTEMENIAVATFYQWLQAAGPDKALLRESLAMLQHHEAAMPDATGSIKANYLAFRRDPEALWPALWEQERQVRIRNAVVAGLLREINKPYWKTGAWGPGKRRSAEPDSPIGLETGLPLETGPGSDLSAAQWEEFVRQSSRFENISPFYAPREFVAETQRSIRAAQVVTALSLYQADNGRPPGGLEELTSRGYLQTLPVNPYHGETFSYRIFEGDDANMFAGLQLVPGQAFILIQGGPRPLHPVLPVPVWMK